MTVKNAANVAELDRAAFELEVAMGDLRHVMSDARGRRFLWNLLGDCGLYRLSFNHSGSITSFNEGERNVGLKLQHRMIQASSELYLTAQSEAVALAESERKRQEDSKT